jgi:Flp pilus assembly protein TadD
MYLPSIGGFLALSASLFILVEKLKDRWKGIGNAVVGVLAVIVVVLTGTTYARNRVWEDELTLWQDVVTKSPDKARVHNALGTSYMREGLTDKAIEHFRYAIQLSPLYAKAHYNLGIAYGEKGWNEEAYREMKRGLELEKLK